jgi:hypothetical protein
MFEKEHSVIDRRSGAERRRVVNYPAHRAGHLKTILAAWEIFLVRDDTVCSS